MAKVKHFKTVDEASEAYRSHQGSYTCYIGTDLCVVTSNGYDKIFIDKVQTTQLKQS